MPKLEVVNANNVIEFNPQKANFKLKNTGGPKGDTGAQGPQGPKGETGAQGPAGASASVTVGSTTTLSPGADATVTNSGDTRNAILNFGIPTGARGPKGDTGSKGDTGPIGPKGAKGDTGAAATVQVGNTNTGAPGTNAQVTNAGNEHFAVFNFTIPRGDKGEKGATGAQGPKGPAGQDGTDGFSPIATVTQEGLDAEISITDKDGTTTATVPGFGVQVVESLPATGSPNVIYLERDSNSASGNPISIADAVQAPLKSLEIQGNTTQQTYTGKNLLPNNLQTRTLNGVTFTRKNDGSIKISGTATGRAEPMLWVTSQGGSLVFTAGKTYKNTTSVALYFHASGYFKIDPGATYSPTANQNCDQVYIRVENGETVDTTIFPQIIESGADESYEPYVGGVPAPNPDYPQAVQTVTGENVVKISDGQGNEQSYEVNLGKNLFDKSTVMDGYRLGSDGTPYADASYSLSTYIPVQPNTQYSYSRGEKTTGASNAICYYDNSKTFISRTTPIINTQQTSGTLTTPSNAAYVRIAELTSQLDTMQYELGSQATSYAPYFTPIELCKIGTYQDYIYKDGTDWKIHKEIGKSVLNGSEPNWATQTSGGLKRYSVNRTDSKSFPSRTSDASLSSHFTPSITDAVGIFFVATQTYYFYPDQTIATLDSWKTWLASNNVALYYQLATPADTTITNATLIAQLEAILAGGTQAGANTIALTPSAGATGTLEVEYYDSYDSYLWVNNRWEKFAHLG